jgi:pilus assembly protein FimV
MSSGKNPLVLMMALSMPGAAQALGLGEIHVDSGLNERLAAEIDIVGATALDLTDLRAAVANRETFLRYGVDRPAFLSSATFNVTQDGQGRPVLAVHSTESFTDPVVNFLVDLHWRNGELVRQYTLLLDPANFAPASRAASIPAMPAATVVPAASNIPAATNVPAAANTSVATNISAAPDVSAAPDSPPAAAATMPIAETALPTLARQPSSANTEQAVRKTTHIKVGAKATLRGVAWRVGLRSESDLQRMMIAIFRANPSAFDGNINRLHLGAVLTIPARTELARISKAEAKREIHAQMAAWHAPVRAVAASSPMSATSAPTASVAVASVATPSVVPVPTANALPEAAVSAPAAEKVSETPADEALGQRVQSLEKELGEMKGLLERGQDQLIGLQRQAARIEKPAAAVNSPQPKSAHPALVPVLAGLGTLAAALAILYFKLRRRLPAARDLRNASDAATGDPAPAQGTADAIVDAAASQTVASSQMVASSQTVASSQAQYVAQEPAPEVAADAEQEPAADDATQPLLPVLSAVTAAGRSEISAGGLSRAETQARAATSDATVNLHVDTVNLRVDQTRLDYNLLDLDLTAQHVQMPSVLNENAVVKERRTNLADVLRLAIEREPDRHDLRMKLLELYYAAAATNRQAFLDVVQKFARDRDYLHTEQWDKIAFMGRQIASENPLFVEESSADDDLADCA